MRIMLICLVLAACATDPVRVRQLADVAYAPHRGIVAVLTAAPEREHVPLAELSVVAGPDALVLLRNRARDLGADAIVLLEEDRLEAVARSVNPSYASTVRVRALAIRIAGN